MKAAFAAYG
jgi:hypothetical protein